MDVHPVVERVGNFNDGALAHAVDKKIGLRVEQNRALELIGPVVVMREPPKACLNAADDDGGFFVALADQIAVDRHSVVRALSHEAAGRVCVNLPVMAGDGIVVHH